MVSFFARAFIERVWLIATESDVFYRLSEALATAQLFAWRCQWSQPQASRGSVLG